MTRTVRRFKPLTAVESSDQTTYNKREIIHVEKQLVNSELMDIGQYLERGKKKVRELDSSQRVDRAMEAFQKEIFVEHISDGSLHHSKGGTPPRRQPETEHGLGSSCVDPSRASQSQAAVVPIEVAQALKEAEDVRKDRQPCSRSNKKQRKNYGFREKDCRVIEQGRSPERFSDT